MLINHYDYYIKKKFAISYQTVKTNCCSNFWIHRNYVNIYVHITN